MAQRQFTFREMTDDDGQLLSALYESSPDTGNIQVAPQYHLDAYTASTAMYKNAIGVVAEADGEKGLVGAGFVSFSRCQFEGALRNCAVLKGLVVHPHYRRRGIAQQLVAWRVEYARKRVGEEGVLVAAIQEKNEGSFAVARSWSQQFAGELRNGVIRMRTAPPDVVPELTVRPVMTDDTQAVVDQLNAFYQGYNFYEPYTVDSLTEWLQETPLDTPFRHYYVVSDKAGNLLAGLAVIEQHRLVEMRVDQMPIAVNLINKLVKLVPEDRKLRQLSATKIWFAHDHIEEARFLWETIRWQWHERGNTLTFAYDSRSPLKKVFDVPFWLPQARLQLAVHAPVPMREERLIYPV